jgi:integrase
LALKFDENAARWTIVGDAEEYRMSEGWRTISYLLENADEPLGPKDITAMLNERGHKVKDGAVREMLSNPRIVHEMLGHVTISQTMDTYSHVMPGMQDVAVTAIETRGRASNWLRMLYMRPFGVR